MEKFYRAVFALILPVLVPCAALGQDVSEGEKIWKKCRSCHEIGLGAETKVGPHMNDVIGRAAASINDFRYSKALIDASKDGLVWDLDNLDKFLTRPKSFIRKTRMTFSGLKRPEDRANLLAFLAVYTGEDSSGARDKHLTANDPDVPGDVLAIVGDKEYGEYLSATCVTCHQIDGSDAGIPSITGWPKDAFVTVMYSYRSRFRENPVMRQIAGSLNNDEIAGLAAYFEELVSGEE